MIRKGLAVIIILLFIEAAIIPSNGQKIEKPSQLTSKGNTLYVGGIGPGNYSSIQAAINNASDGDLIYIYAGTYYEPLILRKSLTLQGQDANTTIIDGCRAFYTFYVNVTEFHIQSLGFRNTSQFELEIEAANDSSIIDCRFTGNPAVERNGIRIDKAARLHILGCTIINYLDGIDAINTVDSLIERCMFSTKQRSVSINLGCSNCHVDHCTVTGQPESDYGNRGMDVYSPKNLITDCVLFGLGEGICMFDRSNFTNIINCTISNCTMEGIQCVNSHDHLIKRCTISRCGLDSYYNMYAMEILDRDNIIDTCTIKDNPGGGVEFSWLGGQNTLCCSTLIHNGYSGDKEGLFSNSHAPNYIYLNNFNDNHIQAWDYYHTGTWDNGTLGNYYSDYTGIDRDNNAIGDTPYTLYDHSNNDTHPLICPYNPDGPSIRIIRPTHTLKNYLYLRNIRLSPHKNTILLGTTQIKVCAIDYNNLDAHLKVEFFVDGYLRHTDSNAPYAWTWRIHSLLHHTHSLTATAYDSLGHAGSDTLVLKKFF